MPLIEEPAAGRGATLAVFISGDGGWASIDRQVAGKLVAAGVSVVGLNSLKYFWTRRTPDETGRDLERILRHYLSATGRPDVVLVGYSRGADVLPFMVSRLPEDLKGHVRLIALLGPGRSVDFKFHVVDWLADKRHASDVPTLPEARKLLGVARLLCVYGADDADTICPDLQASSVEVVPLKGSHHFDGAYEELGDLVVRALSAQEAPPPARALP